MKLVIKRHQLIPNKNEFKSVGEEYRFWGFVAGLSFPGFHIGLNTLITSFIGSNSIDTLLAYLILFCSLGLAYLYTPRKDWKKYFTNPFLYTVLITFLFVVSIVMFDGHTAIIRRISTTYFQTVFFGAFAFNLLDDEKLIKKALRLIAYIVFFSLVFEPFASRSTLFKENDSSWGTSGYLTWGYRMLIAVILLFYCAFELHRKIDWGVCVFSTIELAVIGNRGSLISIALFIILYVILCTKSSKKFKYFVILLGGMAICLLIFSEDILIQLQKFLSSIGIQSRNLTKILNDTMNESGRDAGYEIALQQIKSGNLIGLGVGGDQILVGNYPHNILLEFLLQYGNLVGSLLFIVLVVESLICMIGDKDKSRKAIFIAFFCIVMVKLWISSTYIYELWFAPYLLLIVRTRKQMKISKHKSSLEKMKIVD